MSTISPVVVSNMALANVASKSNIESLDENSAAAAQCKLWYSFSLNQCLESYDWSFARKRDFLAVAGDAPNDEWSFRYVFPADCAAPRRIWNPCGPDADAVPFDIEIDSNDARTIVTNIDKAQLVYTRMVTNTALFPPLFIELLARCLATHIAFPLTGKREIVGDQNNAFQALLRSAPAYDANERVGRKPRDAEWVRGRSFNGYFDRHEPFSWTP